MFNFIKEICTHCSNKKMRESEIKITTNDSIDYQQKMISLEENNKMLMDKINQLTKELTITRTQMSELSMAIKGVYEVVKNLINITKP